MGVPMIKPTLAAIALVSALTGTAYFYLPDPPQPPVNAASQHQPPPPPVPGNKRYPEARQPQPPETFVPLGLLAVGILWMRSLKT